MSTFLGLHRYSNSLVDAKRRGSTKVYRDQLPTRLFQKRAHLRHGTLLTVEGGHHLQCRVRSSNRIIGEISYDQVLEVAHSATVAPVGKQRLWRHDTLRPCDVGKFALRARVRDQAVEYDELSRRRGGFTEMAQDGDAVLVRPVVHDVSHEEHVGILDWLALEEVVHCDSLVSGEPYRL